MELPRQTKHYLRELLEERGIRPKGKLGQNFLIDLNLIELLLRSAELTRDDLVLEVGCGTGSLTARLAQEAGAVVGVEIDPAFFQLAGEVIDNFHNVRLQHRDVLAGKHEIAPEVYAAVEEAATFFNCTRRKLVANLPYSIATPLIGNLLVDGFPLERMVVTVQWEIAERLTAAVGDHGYSSLAVFVQSVADVTLVRRIGPTVFWPRPLVDSAFVMIKPNAAKRERVGDVQRWRTFLRDLYVHRRKNLRGALSGWPGGRRDKPGVDKLLADLGLDPTTRAEDLDLEQHLRLCKAFFGDVAES